MPARSRLLLRGCAALLALVLSALCSGVRVAGWAGFEDAEAGGPPLVRAASTPASTVAMPALTTIGPATLVAVDPLPRQVRGRRPAAPTLLLGSAQGPRAPTG